MSWKQVRIADLGKVITGNTPPKKRPELYGKEYKFIKPTDMEIGMRYTPSTEEYYSVEGFKKYESSLIPPLSTCVVTIGSIGKKITLTDEYCFVNQAVNAVVPNEEKYDPFFVFYALKNILRKVKAADTGASSGRENVSKSNFSSITLEVPEDKTVQQKIASILSAHDDLIENNVRRIKLLEEAAQNIYVEWFEKFHFPGYESKEFINGLPNGWSRELLESQLAQVKRKPKISTDRYQDKGAIPIIDQGADFIAAYTDDEQFLQGTPLPLLVFGDHTRRVKYVDFPFASGADGTQLMYPTNESLLPCYFYFAVKKIDLSDYAYTRHYKFLKQKEILIPDSLTLEKFNNLIAPFLIQIRTLRGQIADIKEAREILMPRLMNQTIQV